VVDVLSRKAHEMYISAINIYNTYLKNIILEATNSHQHHLKLKETLQQGDLQQKFNYYELKEDGILTYRGKMYVSNLGEMKNTMWRKMHNLPYVWNPGYHKSKKWIIT